MSNYPPNAPEHEFNNWLDLHSRLAVAVIVLSGFLLRLWAASGTFFNPDEALHFLLANQASFMDAYRASLTQAHPPLFILLLYFWKFLGVSEIALRLPSVISGTLFCWMFFRWMNLIVDRTAAWIGLIFVTFLPPMIALSAEVRQYALMLLFISCAAYWFEQALATGSPVSMALSALSLGLGMMTHYSALLFAAAFGVYSLLRLLSRRFSARIYAIWILGQGVALALFAFLYRTHISKFKGTAAAGTVDGWLRNSFFHPGDNPLLFIFARTFGVFQYTFGQLVVGDIGGLLFIATIVFLLRGSRVPNNDGPSPRQLAVLLVVPFALTCLTAFIDAYPYGGTRHSAFLAIFAIAGVSWFLSVALKQRLLQGFATATLIVVLCNSFGVPHRPYMRRDDQSRANMDRAMAYLQQNVARGGTILTDFQSGLLLGHYLCQQKPTNFDKSTPGFSSFNCQGLRVIATDQTTNKFTPGSLRSRWNDVIADYTFKEDETVWVVQMGWEISPVRELASGMGESRELVTQSFGRNISLLKLTVGKTSAKTAGVT